MRTRAARYDHRVTFRAMTVARDPKFNTRAKSWADHATVFAQVLDLLPSRGEQIADGVDIRRKPCRLRIRWRADINPDMRVVIGGIEHAIVGGPAEVGRREELELVCEALSTTGDGA